VHVAATPRRKRFRLQGRWSGRPIIIFDHPSRQGFREALRRLASSVRTSLNEGRQIGCEGTFAQAFGNDEDAPME
jgi:hypothetical protein